MVAARWSLQHGCESLEKKTAFANQVVPRSVAVTVCRHERLRSQQGMLRLRHVHHCCGPRDRCLQTGGTLDTCRQEMLWVLLWARCGRIISDPRNLSVSLRALALDLPSQPAAVFLFLLFLCWAFLYKQRVAFFCFNSLLLFP